MRSTTRQYLFNQNTTQTDDVELETNINVQSTRHLLSGYATVQLPSHCQSAQLHLSIAFPSFKAGQKLDFKPKDTECNHSLLNMSAHS